MKMKSMLAGLTRHRIVIVLFAMILIGSNMNVIQARASSATLTFSTSTPEIKKGETFSVVLTIRSSATVGDFEAYVFYDPEVMEFKSGGSFISGGDGLLRISDMNTETANTTKKYSMKFKAREVGACEVGISDTAIAYDYDEGSEMSLSSNRLSISVISSEKLSKNNELETLKISPGTLTPEFDPKVLNYSAKVPSDTDKLFVAGVAKDADATVTVKGNDKLNVGDNSVVITVVAPSGDEKEYYILVKREEGSIVPDASASPLPTNENETVDGFTVYSEDGNTYIKNSFEYQVMNVTDETEIPSGYVKTSIIINGVSVSAYTPENDLDSDFLLIYVKNQDGNEGFYQYDRVEQTLQRVSNATLSNMDSSAGTDKVITADEYADKLQKLSVVIAVLSAITVFLIIVVIRCYYKLKGYNEDDLD